MVVLMGVSRGGIAGLAPILCGPYFAVSWVSSRETLGIRRVQAMTVLLRTDHLSCRFGGLVAVGDVDLSVEAGHVHGLIGPNGAGKTTFLNLISGHIRQTSGTIIFDGQDLGSAPPDFRAVAGIRRTFQNLRLFREMTAIENVMVGLHANTRSEIFSSLIRTGAQRREEKDIVERARAALEFVGLFGIGEYCGRKPAVWTSAATRNRAGLRRQTETDFGRRTGRRFESHGSGTTRRIDPAYSGDRHNGDVGGTPYGSGDACL